MPVCPSGDVSLPDDDRAPGARRRKLEHAPVVTVAKSAGSPASRDFFVKRIFGGGFPDVGDAEAQLFRASCRLPGFEFLSLHNSSYGFFQPLFRKPLPCYFFVSESIYLH